MRDPLRVPLRNPLSVPLGPRRVLVYEGATVDDINLHDLKDPKLRLWELWYIPDYGYCLIYIINRSSHSDMSGEALGAVVGWI